jgi:DNA polymerase III epsilon subunit-like protein
VLVCVFDCEAAGLIANSGIEIDKQPRLLEFYACLADPAGHIQGELHFLCDPEINIPKEITKITGIDNAMVAGQPKFREQLEKLQDLFFSAEAVVGHNLTYDMAIINFELLRAGVKPDLFWPEIKVCTVEQTEHLFGYRPNLTQLYEKLFHTGFTGAHRAQADVQATLRCYVELLRLGVI